MRLFISSSEKDRSFPALVVALAVAVSVIFGMETWLRAHGAVPSFDNNTHRWAQARSQLQRDTSENSILLLGASRMQAGISHRVLNQVFPEARIHNLASAGQAPFATMVDVAENTNFRGLVVMSILPPWLVPGLGREEQNGLVQFYHQDWNWARALDTWLTNQVAANFALADIHYGPTNIIRNILKHGRPVDRPDHVVTSHDREQHITFSNSDLGKVRRNIVRSGRAFTQEQTLPTPQEFQYWVDDLMQHIQKIKDRGGRVVLVRMPSSGPIRNFEHQHFPRDMYWQRIEQTVTTPILNFEDYAELVAFDLPDYSHVDATEKERFTEALIGAILKLDGI